jgi:EAL domain-containing protein (putative c-di-GMP-specific phosphodiesterase class I)
VRIVVNVSPLQLRNRGFIAGINQAIGTDEPAAAGLELTESLILAPHSHTAKPAADASTGLLLNCPWLS